MPVGTRKWFFALPSLLCGGLAFAGTSNGCSDPYWSNTLRCKALTYLFPTPPLPAPQPVPEPPTSVGDIKAYTRVDLDDPSIRCLDGTRPIIYVDRAVGDPSNRWLISMTGGGACAARDADGNGSLEGGQDCLNGYLTDQTQGSSTASADAMSSLTDVDGSGILSADPARNPVFCSLQPYSNPEVWLRSSQRSCNSPRCYCDAPQRRPHVYLRSLQPWAEDRTQSA